MIGFAILRSHPKKKSSETFAAVICKACTASTEGAKRGKGGGEPVIASFAPETEEDLLAQWWVAALVHDTAYGIEVLQGTLELLGYFARQPRILSFSKKVKDEVASLSRDIAGLAPDEFEKDSSIDRGDHGLIAASHLLETLREHGDAVARRYMGAVRAVAFHNSKHPTVHAGRDPVAALLILCDTVQDWGRSSLGFDRSPTVVLSRLVSSAPPPPDEQFGPAERFSFSLQPVEDGANPCRQVWVDEAALRIQIDYPARVRKGPQVFFTWADTTLNLQRVDFTPWKAKILVEQRTPRQRSEPHPQSKLAEFAEVIRRQEAGFLQHWLEVASLGSEEGAVCHKLESFHPTDERPAFECVTWNLSKLWETLSDEMPLMGISFKPFQDTIEEHYGKSALGEDDDPKQRPPV